MLLGLGLGHESHKSDVQFEWMKMFLINMFLPEYQLKNRKRSQRNSMPIKTVVSKVCHLSIL